MIHEYRLLAFLKAGLAAVDLLETWPVQIGEDGGIAVGPNEEIWAECCNAGLYRVWEWSDDEANDGDYIAFRINIHKAEDCVEAVIACILASRVRAAIAAVQPVGILLWIGKLNPTYFVRDPETGNFKDPKGAEVYDESRLETLAPEQKLLIWSNEPDELTYKSRIFN